MIKSSILIGLLLVTVSLYSLPLDTYSFPEAVSIMDHIETKGCEKPGDRYNIVNRSSGATGRWQLMPGTVSGLLRLKTMVKVKRKIRYWKYDRASGKRVLKTKYVYKKKRVLRYKFLKGITMWNWRYSRVRQDKLFIALVLDNLRILKAYRMPRDNLHVWMIHNLGPSAVGYLKYVLTKDKRYRKFRRFKYSALNAMYMNLPRDISEKYGRRSDRLAKAYLKHYIDIIDSIGKYEVCYQDRAVQLYLSKVERR